MTPEEYAADRELYDTDLPFINRILAAIQRFERTRKLSPERRDIFYKYLAYGGVNISPNMFQTAADIDKTGMDKDDLAMAMSKVSIGSDKYDLSSDKALYTVDFLGCARAFLSRHAATLYGFETYEQVGLVTTTLERFMDYLLQHDVCIDYTREVIATRDLCRSATSELWACAEAYRWLPGDFNIACSTLFGGYYSHYDGVSDWSQQSEEPTFVGLTTDQAIQIVKFGVAGAATEAVYQKYLTIVNSSDGSNLEVVNRIPDAGFTITKIIQPTKDCIKLYKSQSADFRPVGRVVATHWVNPDQLPADLTEAERRILNVNGKPSDVPQFSKSHTSKLTEIHDEVPEYTFFIPLPLITYLRVGMHIEATIHELNCGIWFFDDYRVVYPGFDVFLTNDFMVGWKEPRWLKGSVEWERENGEEEEEGEEASEEAVKGNEEGEKKEGGGGREEGEHEL